nr:uncharacterized protein LOC109178709 [Ipomoea trifida]
MRQWEAGSGAESRPKSWESGTAGSVRNVLSIPRDFSLSILGRGEASLRPVSTDRTPSRRRDNYDDRSEYIVQERENHSDGDSQRIASTTHEKAKLYTNTSEALENSVEKARRLPSIKLR